ncbi:uncharacterized protein B4U80_07221 [Leptotrombidium deliense]|uniref:DUF659 domain-containing protein n=1 Tax=Leptotrombidium deliense TaxID=299467 RepID=A0A443S2K7_9ACAR|nr:uncharacterized protein B4U80_07221 [Leptotrombidium deliense]
MEHLPTRIKDHLNTLIKYCIKPIYDEYIQKIRNVVGDNDVFFIVDETTDRMTNYVVNILVGVLNGYETKPMLLKVSFVEKTNNYTIGQSVMAACNVLWDNKTQYAKLKLMVTDQATYMLLAVSVMKQGSYQHLNHITCLAHAAHRVADTIREAFPKVNKFISNMKKVLLKSKHRQQMFRTETSLPLPPKAVITRWGTWLEACFFYIDNFEKISSFIKTLKAKSAALEAVKKALQKPIVKNELMMISNYRFVVSTIKKLEEQNLTSNEQRKILEEMHVQLDGEFKEKLEFSLSRNPDLNKFLSTDLPFEEQFKRKYAPLVSVEVERSFSVYKSFFRDNRSRFTHESIEHNMVISYNSFQ